MRRAASARSLSTAHTTIQLLKYLASFPGGVQAKAAAAHLEKSVSTAYYLLNTLCQEGLAYKIPGSLYRLQGGLQEALVSLERTAHTPNPPPALYEAVRELYNRTKHRTYLALVEKQQIIIDEVQGRQGQPKPQGVGAELRECAHAMALSKVVLAHLGDQQVNIYLHNVGLKVYTPKTLSDPEAFQRELAAVRQRGFALDCEEFAEGLCCIAAPIFDDGGAVRASVGLSVSSARFAAEGRELTESVKEVARIAGGSYT